MKSQLFRAKNIDSYLATLPEKQILVLEKLRQTIRKAAPEAEEVISYQIPAFKYYGLLVGFAGFKNHCSFFPMGSETIRQFQNDLKNFETSKGTIRFTPDKPLPSALVRKIVKARMKRNLDKKALKAGIKSKK
jgi:uncharacterized protein YdhG (YjbR/CyaY superfamily)